MFTQFLRKKKLRELGEIHSLLSVLSTPEIVCFGQRYREIAGMAGDMPNKSPAHIRNIVGRAEKMGVVKIKQCPYAKRKFEMVSLSIAGVRIVHIFKKLFKRKRGK